MAAACGETFFVDRGTGAQGGKGSAGIAGDSIERALNGKLIGKKNAVHDFGP
jgi:hypothetical protein